MSRIGKLPITIPDKVIVLEKGKNIISVKGNFGELEESYPFEKLVIEISDSTLRIKPKYDSRENRQLQGLYRTLINNMVVGVTEKFTKTLEINGVGYRAQIKGKELVLNLGFSHPINFEIPTNIDVKVEGNHLTIEGISKHEVGLFAANIRSKRPPEPYKGKGIKYKDEIILRKVGKSGKK